MCPNRKAFTLVEMLVALAVSSIVIIAAYASYDMVKTQYEKNIDIADIHTSGRAVMRIIERDIRMAGYEHQDSSGNKIFSTGITSQLVLSESNNACCDGVSVIYDHPTDTTDGVERRRITYSVIEFPGEEEVDYELLDSDVARYRLYKKTDVLGRDGIILATEESGTKQVLADFVEDLQFINVENNSILYVGDSIASRVWAYNPATGLGSTFGVSDISHTSGMAYNSDDEELYIGDHYLSQNISIYSPAEESSRFITASGIGRVFDMAFGSDKKLYVADETSNNVWVYNPSTGLSNNFRVSGISGNIESMASGPNGKLYFSDRSNLAIYDPLTGSTTVVGISGGTFFRSMTSGYGDNLYWNRGGSGDLNIGIYNPETRSSSSFSVTIGFDRIGSMTLSPNGKLYISESDTRNILIYDLLTDTSTIIDSGLSRNGKMTIRTNMSGQESLVNIKLTLRSKNKRYSENKIYTKAVDEEHHIGNYNFEFNDKYKRDVFFSTVAVRNMLL